MKQHSRGLKLKENDSDNNDNYENGDGGGGEREKMLNNWKTIKSGFRDEPEMDEK